MKTTRRLLGKLGLLAVTLAATQFPLSAMAQQKVTLTLNWTPYGLHVGPVVARERGLYKAAGLDVEILRGYGSSESVKRSAMGTTTFAMADPASVALGRDKGLLVRQLATVMDRSSDAMYFRKNAGIKTPKDLEGKTVGIAAGESHLALFPAFAKKANIDVSKIKWVTFNPPAKIPSLMGASVDAVMTYATEEPTLDSAAIKAKTGWDKFAFSDFGVDNYSIGIIASDELIKKDPELVRKFVSATMAGYALAVDDPEGAASDFVKSFPETSRDLILAQWRIVAQYLLTDTAKEKGYGYIREDKMAATLDYVKAFSKLENPIKATDLFSMDYLKPTMPSKK